MIRTLGELEAGEAAVMLLEGFSYFRLFYSFQGVKRKLNPMFGSVSSSGERKGIFTSINSKRFKAYLFAYRSEKAVLAPSGWSLATQTELDILANIAQEKHQSLGFSLKLPYSLPFQ